MDEKFSFPVLVEGEWNPALPNLKNKLTIYFQSKKSNGGDCHVQHHVSDGRKAVVWFKTEEGKVKFCNGHNDCLLVVLLQLGLIASIMPMSFLFNSAAKCSYKVPTFAEAG